MAELGLPAALKYAALSQERGRFTAGSAQFPSLQDRRRRSEREMLAQ